MSPIPVYPPTASPESGTPLPAVHLNGTGRTTLLSEYTAALAAVATAEDAFLDITCHPRDYYIYPGGDAWSRAKDAREQQLSRLRDLRHYLQAHVDHLTPH